MPQHTFFNTNLDNECLPKELAQLGVQHVMKPDGLINEHKEFNSTLSNTNQILNDDENFIIFVENHNFAVNQAIKEFGIKAIKCIKDKINKTKLNKREKLVYEILKELEGIKSFEIPAIEYSKEMHIAIFDFIAEHYATNEAYVKDIKTFTAFTIYPQKAKILPSIFPLFPNILNDIKLNEKEELRLPIHRQYK